MARSLADDLAEGGIKGQVYLNESLKDDSDCGYGLYIAMGVHPGTPSPRSSRNRVCLDVKYLGELGISEYVPLLGRLGDLNVSEFHPGITQNTPLNHKQRRLLYIHRRDRFIESLVPKSQRREVLKILLNA